MPQNNDRPLTKKGVDRLNRLHRLRQEKGPAAVDRFLRDAVAKASKADREKKAAKT